MRNIYPVGKLPRSIQLYFLIGTLALPNSPSYWFCPLGHTVFLRAFVFCPGRGVVPLMGFRKSLLCTRVQFFFKFWCLRMSFRVCLRAKLSVSCLQACLNVTLCLSICYCGLDYEYIACGLDYELFLPMCAFNSLRLRV